GGAMSLCHPIGAAGGRVVLHVLKVLERTGGKRGVASLCIGGGQGGAMLLQRAWAASWPRRRGPRAGSRASPSAPPACAASLTGGRRSSAPASGCARSGPISAP